MRKRVITAAAGVVGLVVIGLGVASATVWRADDVMVATTTASSHVVVTDPGVLELGGDPATVRVTASDGAEVVVVVGRDTDVDGWVGSDDYTRVTGLSAWDALATTTGAPDAAAVPTDAPTDAPTAAPTDAPTPAPSAAATPAPTGSPTANPSAAATAAASATPSATPTAKATAGAEAPAVPTQASPAGNDNWVAQATGEGSAELVWPAQPGRWSLLAVSRGEAAPTLEISWPRVVTTPWLWPCVVVGALIAAAAGVLLLRDWSSRRTGTWEPVHTGSVPVAATEGQPLTRRRLREAQEAARTGRPPTGPVPRVTGPQQTVHAPHEEGRHSSAPALTPIPPLTSGTSPVTRPDDARSASSAPVGSSATPRPEASEPGAAAVPGRSAPTTPIGSVAPSGEQRPPSRRALRGSSTPTSAIPVVPETPGRPAPVSAHPAPAAPSAPSAPSEPPTTRAGLLAPQPAPPGSTPSGAPSSATPRAGRPAPVAATGYPVGGPSSPAPSPAAPRPAGSSSSAPRGSAPGAPAPSGPAPSAPVSRDAAAARPVPTGSVPTGPVPTSPDASGPASSVPPASSARPAAWSTPGVPAPAPAGAAGTSAADHAGRTRPSWLGARTPGAPSGTPAPPPTGSTGPVLPSPGGWVPHTPTAPTAPGPDTGARADGRTGPDAAADASPGETAGSRADAWRRAWGLPAAPGTDEGAPTQEGQR